MAHLAVGFEAVCSEVFQHFILPFTPEPTSVPQVVRSSQQFPLIPALRNPWDYSGHVGDLSGPFGLLGTD